MATALALAVAATAAARHKAGVGVGAVRDRLARVAPVGRAPADSCHRCWWRRARTGPGTAASSPCGVGVSRTRCVQRSAMRSAHSSARAPPSRSAACCSASSARARRPAIVVAQVRDRALPSQALLLDHALLDAPRTSRPRWPARWRPRPGPRCPRRRPRRPARARSGRGRRG